MKLPLMEKHDWTKVDKEGDLNWCKKCGSLGYISNAHTLLAVPVVSKNKVNNRRCLEVK